MQGIKKQCRSYCGTCQKIITEMQKGNKSLTDPYIEQILHDCVDILKEAKNPEARRLTGLARYLLLFLAVNEVLVMDDGWSVKMTGTLELTQSFDVPINNNNALSR